MNNQIGINFSNWQVLALPKEFENKTVIKIEPLYTDIEHKKKTALTVRLTFDDGSDLKIDVALNWAKVEANYIAVMNNKGLPLLEWENETNNDDDTKIRNTETTT